MRTASSSPISPSSGIGVGTGIQPAIVYTYFNMEDPVVGGYTTDKIALRRAISMAYNVDEEIRIVAPGTGRAVDAADCRRMSNGHDPNFTRLRALRRRRREGAARQVRLHRSRRRRLARPARRQAAGAVAGLAAVEQRPAVRRAVAKEPRRRRPAHRIRQAEVAGPFEDGARRQAADVDAGRIRARRRTASTSSICCTGRTPAIRICRASACPNSTRCSPAPA